MNINSSYNFIRPSFTANVMPKNCAEYIDNKLKSAKSVDIFCHTASDEDTFNSAKAMYSYLQSQGIQPRIIVSGGKDNYKYDIHKYEILQDNKINKNTEKADLALCVDFSAKNRVSTNTLEYLNSYGSNIVGFDHHNDSDIVVKDYNKITKSYEKNSMPTLEAKNYYIDSSAKSNSAIISRFFDAIGHKTSKEEAKTLFAGMFDDTSKDGITKVSKLGQIVVSDKLNDNGNTKEVMNNVLKNLNVFDKLSILKHFLDKTKLTEKEIAFSKSLSERAQYSNNGKFAYIEITPNDKEWEDLGKDTTRTKKVLQHFRKETLSNNKDIDAVAVFYPTNDNIYKMSLQTKADYAKQIIDNIKASTCPELVAGGHENRSGGTINTTDAKKCHEWVELFKQSADEVLGK